MGGCLSSKNKGRKDDKYGDIDEQKKRSNLKSGGDKNAGASSTTEKVIERKIMRKAPSPPKNKSLPSSSSLNLTEQLRSKIKAHDCSIKASAETSPVYRNLRPAPRPPVYRNLRPAPSPPVYRNLRPAPSPPAYRNLRPAPRPPVYRNLRPVPSPPVYRNVRPEPRPPVRAITDTTSRSTKIVPVNEYGRKDRRKTLLDLFKVKKKRKKSMN